MHADTTKYNDSQPPADREIFELLALEIDRHLPEAENKIWHAHPVWFLDGNPIVGYSKLKGCVRLLFWSGQSFGEKGLKEEGTFKAAEVRYTTAGQGARDVMRSPPACLRNSRSAPHAASTSRPSRCCPSTSSSGT